MYRPPLSYSKPFTCVCGGIIRSRTRCCDECGISGIKLYNLELDYREGRIRFTKEMRDRWKKEKIIPTDKEFELLPVEIFDWV